MFRAPRPASLPHLYSLIDNIGYGHDTIGRYLDLAPSTVRRYIITEGQAPRPVMLGLFWESTWGTVTADAAVINQSRQLYSENLILKRRISAQASKTHARRSLLLRIALPSWLCGFSIALVRNSGCRSAPPAS